MANTDVTSENQSSSNINEGPSLENSEVHLEDRPLQNPPSAGKKPKPQHHQQARNPDGLVSIYITSFEGDPAPKVDLDRLAVAAPDVDLRAAVATEFGVVISLLDDGRAQKVLKLDLGRIFGQTVQAVPLYSGHFRRTVTFEDVPWCIRTEEVEACLRRQGVGFETLTREKSTLYVEVGEYRDYRSLREAGINFYDAVVFRAAEDGGLNEEVHYNNDNIIQCYKCQGFWHTANACKQRVRCVRCGEEHHVDACNRPKNSPICCNCKGPHHAAYKLCPLRLKLKKSVRVSFTFDQ